MGGRHNLILLCAKRREIGSIRSVFEFPQAHEQGRYIDLDDAPDSIVVHAQIAVNEPITGGDHQSPGHVGVLFANELRYMAGRLAYQFKVS